jgi:hypothetical protein
LGFVFCAVIAAALETKVIVSSAEGVPDGEILFNIYLENNPGISNFGLSVKYNSDKFTYISAEPGDIITENFEVFENTSGGWVTVAAYTGNGDIISDGKNLLFKIKFKISKEIIDTHVKGDDFKIGYFDMFDGFVSNDSDAKYNIVQGIITIEDINSKPESPNPQADEGSDNADINGISSGESDNLTAGSNEDSNANNESDVVAERRNGIGIIPYNPGLTISIFSPDVTVENTDNDITVSETNSTVDLSEAYKKGSIEFNAVRNENNSSSFIIPAETFITAYNATKSAQNPFEFIFTSPFGSCIIPANITDSIQDYTKLTSGRQNISLKITIGKSQTSKLSEITVNAAAAFKFELIDNQNTVIAEITEFDTRTSLMIPIEINISKPVYWSVKTKTNNNVSWSDNFIPAKWEQGAKYITISSSKTGEYIATAFVPKFSDVLKHEWYYDAINLAAAKGLVKGINNEGTLYNPQGSVTRAEFVAMAARALQLPSAKSDVPNYSDVNENDWFIKDGTLMSAKSAGILTLLGSNEFNPNQIIRREEIAYIISKAAEYAGKKSAEEVDLNERFTDVSTIDIKYRKHVETAVKLKLMQGMSAATFEGKGTVTRAQAATVLVNMCRIFNLID